MIFLNYMNAFRALSIFLIVTLHTMHIFSWVDAPNQQKISFIIFGNSTALFLFISGYLFQHLSLNFNTKRYYLSKFSNVLLPYFIISLPLVLYYVFIQPKSPIDPSFIAKADWLQFLSYYAYGNHAYHFWFIPVITLFYLIGPILIGGEKTNILYYLLPLSIVISFLIERSSTPIYNFFHFFSIYVMGMFCSKYKVAINSVLTQNKSVLLFTTLFMLTILAEYLELAPEFKAINYVQKIFFILSVLSFLIKFDPHTNNKLINIIASTSFGVYFLHGYVIRCAYYISSHINELFSTNFNYTLVKGNILILLTVSFITLILSTFLVLMIKRVMGDKAHFLIGNIPSLKKSK